MPKTPLATHTCSHAEHGICRARSSLTCAVKIDEGWGRPVLCAMLALQKPARGQRRAFLGFRGGSH
eukprot:4793038-Pleurochrysis_carterae.AAC.6